VELRLFYTTQQHRTNCHENGAAKELPCSQVSFANTSNGGEFISHPLALNLVLWSVFAASAIAVVAVPMSYAVMFW
jgi:hypothetical protein